jgi:hypothetical protein
MIEAAVVKGFRGLRQLEVDGFGRVNLVIGKNDCGKTALLEALLIAEGAEGASHRALALQSLRRSREALRDFDRFWRPLFWNQDAEQGFSVDLRGSHREPLQVEFRKAEPPPAMLTGQATEASVVAPTWAVEVRIKDRHERTEQIVASAGTVTFPPPSPHGNWAWIQPGKSIGAAEISFFSKLKQNGRESQLLEILGEIDARVLGIEVLALTGTEAELFVRFEPGTPLLPLSMMGDGFQRCFEIGVVASAQSTSFLFVDELDNGLHHSVLEPVWRWLATISASRQLQVFATTHSEECIQAACRAFTALNDDGLRVIRLDRRDDATVAAVYDRAMIEAATRMDVEVRG